MPKEGKGEGRAFGATQIRFDKKKNQIVLEQYSAGEVRLNEIEIDKNRPRKAGSEYLGLFIGKSGNLGESGNHGNRLAAAGLTVSVRGGR